MVLLQIPWAIGITDSCPNPSYNVSELHKFLFGNLPVRGMLVKLTGAWTEILKRRALNTTTGAYPGPVQELLGEMAAAAVLMQASIKFEGALVLQINGDGPVKLAVAEVLSDLSLRATATIVSEVPGDASLSALVNVDNQGRCAVTLDPKNRLPGQQAYQGVVPLFGDQREKLERLSDVLAHYMLQSEQLDTTLVLAADGNVAAGLLIQRVPVKGASNLKNRGQIPNSSVPAGTSGAAQRAAMKLESDPYFSENEDQIGRNEDYNRLAILASSLKREELLTLDAQTILRRLFWDEQVTLFEPTAADAVPHFACTCSRARVSRMIHSLGAAEAESIIAERGEIEVGCDFCGQQYRFDAVDAAQIFTAASQILPGSSSAH